MLLNWNEVQLYHNHYVSSPLPFFFCVVACHSSSRSAGRQATGCFQKKGPSGRPAGGGVEK